METWWWGLKMYGIGMGWEADNGEDDEGDGRGKKGIR